MLTLDVVKRFANKGRMDFVLDVSFSVDNGITVLTGPSGSGKTTILRLIAGALRPDEGIISLRSEIFFDSKKGINRSIQERKVGFVFQDYSLFPHLTAEQNISYGLKAGSRQLVKSEVSKILSLFHIEHVQSRLPREMSGGEQQRVALARALASEPSILLLDEPLSAVDLEIRSRLLDEIENAQRLADIPFIYVTHNEEEANRLGRRRIKLKNGSILN